MTCIQDPLHLYQLLLLVDIGFTLFVNLDMYVACTYLYLLLNTSMVGVAVLAISFPSVSFFHNEYMGGFFGLSVVVLACFSYIASGWAVFFSMGVALLFLGGVVQYAQDYAVALAGFADALTTAEKLALAGGIAVVVVVVVTLIHYVVGVGRVLARCVLYAMVAWVSGRAMWLAGVLPSQYCCDSKSLSTQCAVWLDRQDWMGVVAVFLWRLAATAAFRWFHRYKVRVKVLEEVHAKQIKALSLKQVN